MHQGARFWVQKRAPPPNRIRDLHGGFEQVQLPSDASLVCVTQNDPPRPHILALPRRPFPRLSVHSPLGGRQVVGADSAGGCSRSQQWSAPHIAV
ncbi:hypothetical protein BN2476_670007 [Paraburkholderia piptadeniae]|uniref:Uncharacterized protein n=1 Tax=Paraburkholderia piptadeniae TaxID=1701573 RepID=A0A1N7SPP9_9BURK|nr:hypothetical protein BN2476_670007 [Paraburkholderia piptadeniae]